MARGDRPWPKRCAPPGFDDLPYERFEEMLAGSEAIASGHTALTENPADRPAPRDFRWTEGPSKRIANYGQDGRGERIGVFG
jgi:hypothetical protein